MCSEDWKFNCVCGVEVFSIVLLLLKVFSVMLVLKCLFVEEIMSMCV